MSTLIVIKSYAFFLTANIDQKSKEGQTPLHFACRNSAVNAIKQLIKLGAKINERDEKLRTPLFVAAESGMFALID